MANHDEDGHDELHETIADALRELQQLTQARGMRPSCFVLILADQMVTMAMAQKDPLAALDSTCLMMRTVLLKSIIEVEANNVELDAAASSAIEKAMQAIHGK